MEITTTAGSKTAEEAMETQVLIIGAGPVGMTAALDLAARGIQVILVERSPEQAPPVPKTNHLSARTLEIFRRFGLADKIRAVGLPDDYPNDVAFVTSLTGYQLARLHIPSRRERFSQSGFIDSGWPTSEPAHRCNQMYFEPVIREHVRATAGITTLYNTEITDFDQDDLKVTATGHRTETGNAITIRADYLIGCEGGRSLTRKKIGAVFSGVGIISYNRMVMVKAPDLKKRLSYAPAWMTWFMMPGCHGTLHAIDGKELWSFSFNLPLGQTDFETIKPAEAIRKAVGEDIQYEIVQEIDWVGRRLVADKFSSGRAFTAGDASHIWIPMAGYGMNAGIADATNLTWKLAAVLKGWADEDILETYTSERLPVTTQVSQYVAAVASENYGHDFRKNPPAALYEPGPEGDRVRAEANEFLTRANIDQYNCVGLNFGSTYADSSLVVQDSGKAPAFMLGSYVPSTVPGCRTPHITLAGGSSLYDRLGIDFTLICFDPTIDLTALKDAAAQRGVPLEILMLSPDEAGDVYDYPLVLSRPDQYVAWRGDHLPGDLLGVIDRIRGAQIANTKKETASAQN